MRLALLRHAETEWNRARRIQGRTDVPLADTGRAALRAQCLPATVRGMRLVSSPLLRCVETARLLASSEPEIEPRLVEMHWGRWEGRSLEALRSELGHTMAANEARGLDFLPDGGESPRAVLERVRGWVADALRFERDTLAITHRGVIRVLIADALDWDLTGKSPVKLDSRAVQLLRVDADARLQLLELNVPLEARVGV